MAQREALLSDPDQFERSAPRRDGGGAPWRHPLIVRPPALIRRVVSTR
jgi:hypothetical protein